LAFYLAGMALGVFIRTKDKSITSYSYFEYTKEKRNEMSK
jgi:hypothetical protein